MKDDILGPSMDRPVSVVAADINADGLNDMVAILIDDGHVRWYQQTISGYDEHYF